MKIRLEYDIEADDPILIAGWPGMGNVGIGAVDFLRRSVNAEPFGSIDMSEQFTPEAIVVEEGIAKLPEMPTNSFAFSRLPDLLFFMSESQVSGPAALTLTNLIVDLAEQMEVQRIYTCAAFAVPIGYTEETRVLGVATNEALRDALMPHGAEILGQGMISGLNGLLLGVAKEKEIDGVCLLGEVPVYASRVPNPMAALAVMKVLTTMLEVDIDLGELAKMAVEARERIKQVAAQAMEEYIDYFTEPIWERGEEEDEEE